MITWRKTYTTLAVCLLLVLALGGLFRLPMNAQFTDLVVERAYYADATGQDDLASVQARQFQAFQGPLFLGNNLRPVWLRLTLAPSADPAWVLMLQPNYVHWAEVWRPSASGQWQSVTTGSRPAFNQREVKSLVPSVHITPSPSQPITIYVQVKTPTAPLFVRVLRSEDAASFDSLMSLVTGAFLGVSMIMTLLSIMVYSNTRDKLWGLDAVYNLFGLAVLGLQLGLAQRLLFPSHAQVVDQLTLLANASYVFVTAILHRAFFSLFATPKWLYWPNTIILLAFPVLLGLIAVGAGDKAMALNNLFIFATACWGLLLAINARHSDRFILGVFRAAYGGLVLYFIWWGMPMVLKVQTGNIATLYPSLPASLFTMITLMLILLRNTQLKAREAQRVATEKQNAERQLQEARLRHEETNSFLGMLLHEIKNPLSTIRMTVSNLETALTDQDESVQRRLRRVHESVSSIDEVLERGVEIDSLEQGALTLEVTTLNVAALVADFRANHVEAARFTTTLPAVLIVPVDSHLLGLMLRNLVDNALKYSPAGSPIEIRLSSNLTRWQLEVCSLVGAVGFPDADRVFGKYYRSPLAMRRSGMGLGLYWVRGVARHLGGDAHYAREQDKVVFKLCLPI